VVGAGASAAAGLPLGQGAIRRLCKDLRLAEAALQEEIERLTEIYRLEPQEFETALFAMSRLASESDVRDKLYTIYAWRYVPHLSYELLAHMLKHRFLDAIINFNFDELLDQAVADELYTDEYHYIFSDGHVPADRAIIPTGSAYHLPLLIKPHGTITHKSTLRFTRESYWALPREIRDLLIELVRSAPTTVMTVGFNMQSFEFIKILRHASDNSRLVHINTSRPPTSADLTAKLPEYLLPVSKDRPDGLDVVLYSGT
jgi:hypothetical protein